MKYLKKIKRNWEDTKCKRKSKRRYNGGSISKKNKLNNKKEIDINKLIHALDREIASKNIPKSEELYENVNRYCEYICSGYRCSSRKTAYIVLRELHKDKLLYIKHRNPYRYV